jgi:hypothetical protein
MSGRILGALGLRKENDAMQITWLAQQRLWMSFPMVVACTRHGIWQATCKNDVKTTTMMSTTELVLGRTPPGPMGDRSALYEAGATRRHGQHFARPTELERKKGRRAIPLVFAWL